MLVFQLKHGYPSAYNPQHFSNQCNNINETQSELDINTGHLDAISFTSLTSPYQ